MLAAITVFLMLTPDNTANGLNIAVRVRIESRSHTYVDSLVQNTQQQNCVDIVVDIGNDTAKSLQYPQVTFSTSISTLLHFWGQFPCNIHIIKYVVQYPRQFLQK